MYPLEASVDCTLLGAVEGQLLSPLLRVGAGLAWVEGRAYHFSRRVGQVHSSCQLLLLQYGVLSH